MKTGTAWPALVCSREHRVIAAKGHWLQEVARRPRGKPSFPDTQAAESRPGMHCAVPCKGACTDTEGLVGVPSSESLLHLTMGQPWPS